MLKKYSIIYADPPWTFKNKNTGGSLTSGANAKYSTMSVDDISKLPINNLSSTDSILYMWWVASQPKEALKVVESWGFEIKTMVGFNWVKTTKNDKLHFGMGFYSRSGSEACLIAVKGKPKRINASIRSVLITDENNDDYFTETIYNKVGIHSKKPDIIRDRIVDMMGDLPRIELFARNVTDGWDVFGDEVSNSININNYI